MSSSSAKQAKSDAKSEAKLAKRDAKLSRLAKKEASRKKKRANAPLKYDFHDAFFYTKKTPKEEKKGHKTGEPKLKSSKGATLVDPKAAALLNTGTLQWFEYQTRNIAETKTSKFDKKTLKNMNTLDRFFHSNVEIDELKSQFAQVTVAITTERVAFFKRAHKAWKQVKLKCQDISDDFGKRDSDLPLVGFKDAKRKTSGPLGRHIKIINKFFQQYASYVKYRAEWKEKVLGKKAADPVSVEIREQMTFETEDASASSGEDSESAEDSANSESESEKSNSESEKNEAESLEIDAASDLAPYKSERLDAEQAAVESENSDSSSGASAEESAEEPSSKAAVKKRSPKKQSPKTSDFSSSESSEESAEEKLPSAKKKKSPKDAKALSASQTSQQAKLFQKAKDLGAKRSPTAQEKARFLKLRQHQEFQAQEKARILKLRQHQEFEAKMAKQKAEQREQAIRRGEEVSDVEPFELKPIKKKSKKKRVEYEEIDGIEIDVDEITLADGSKMNLAEDGTLYNMNNEEVGTWDEETNMLKSLRRTPKPKTKRAHGEVEPDNSDNKRASNKKKKKRRKKHKKSKGSASGATP